MSNKKTEQKSYTSFFIVYNIINSKKKEPSIVYKIYAREKSSWRKKGTESAMKSIYKTTSISKLTKKMWELVDMNWDDWDIEVNKINNTLLNFEMDAKNGLMYIKLTNEIKDKEKLLLAKYMKNYIDSYITFWENYKNDKKIPNIIDKINKFYTKFGNTRQGFMKRYEIANVDRTTYIKLIDLYRNINYVLNIFKY